MIQIKNLVKQFGKVRAVNKISFQAEKGEILGFIGPNGAGKTATIRILATLDTPTSGFAYINGHCIVNYPELVRNSIGFMPDYYGTYDGIQVWEYLEFFAAAYKVPRKYRKNIVGDVMELTDLTKVQTKLVSSLSKGMKQRLCLAKTLIHDPQVLILDEPAAGLDPRARIELKMLIKELSSMGKTILISSHILTELADFIHSVVILEHGEVKAFGSVENIQNKLNESVPHALLQLAVHSKKEEALAILQKNTQILKVEEIPKDPYLHIEFAGKDEEIYLLLKELIDKQIPITELKRRRKDLQEIFMDVTDGIVS
ncbi:MAG: ABC transporter ATP-binding protein [Simkania sp.]|nr:ABC transporter ATP-binding protein [Simkania sp.]